MISSTQNKLSRPSIRTEEVENRILAGIRDGRSLIRVCDDDPNLPLRDTVFSWLAADEARRVAREVGEGELLFLDRYLIATKIGTTAAIRD